MSDNLPIPVKSYISVQNDDFSVEIELDKLKIINSAGALVSFVGVVRADEEENKKINALTLEHYPGMCEKLIQGHIDQAAKRWPILAVTVIHRVGYLEVGEQIVLVAVSSQHRKAAFQATEFIMDYLKNEAPFWKKQHTSFGDSWVLSKEKDKQAAKSWIEQS